MVKLKTNYTKAKNDELLELTAHVITKLTDNPYIQKTSPSIAELQTLLDAYAKALSEAVDGTKTNTIIKDEAKEALIHALGNLAKLLNIEYEKSEEALSSVGLPFAESNAHTHYIPPKVENLTLSDGFASGQVQVGFKNIPKAKNYKVCYCTKEALEQNSWQSQLATSTKCLIENLERGKEYFVKVAGTSPEADKSGHYNFSDVVSRIVQ